MCIRDRPRLMPGSALATIISLLTSSNGVSVTGAGGSVFISMEIKQIEAAFGLTPAPWYVQYGRYLEGIFTGNLGVSITYYPEAVAKIISSGLPWTVGLVAVSAVIAFFIGSYLGSIGGFERRSWKDILIVMITSILVAVPAFVIIMYMEMFFSVDHGWLSISFPSKVALTPRSAEQFVRFYTIPIAGLALTLLSGFVLGMRNNMLHTVKDNYVTYAEMLGLDPSKVRKMIYRNSLLPNITGFAIILGLAIGQSLTIEGLLSTPGVGFYFGLGLTSKDLPLLQGIFLVIAIMLVVSIAVAEVVYGILDPRARLSQSE